MALPVESGYSRATLASAGGKKMPNATPSRVWPASSTQNDWAPADSTIPAARLTAVARTSDRSLSQRLVAPPTTLNEAMPADTAARMAARWLSERSRSWRTSGNSGAIIVSAPPRMKYTVNRYPNVAQRAVNLLSARVSLN